MSFKFTYLIQIWDNPCNTHGTAESSIFRYYDYLKMYVIYLHLIYTRISVSECLVNNVIKLVLSIFCFQKSMFSTKTDGKQVSYKKYPLKFEFMTESY